MTDFQQRARGFDVLMAGMTDRRSRRSAERGHARAGAAIPQLPAGRVRNPYPPMEVLSADQVEAIHEASLHILESFGIEVMNAAAAWFARAPHAILVVSSAPAIALPVAFLGILWVCLMRGWLRWLGLPAALAISLWPRPEAPVLWIASDGAAAAVLMTEAEAARRGITPLVRIVSWATAGVDPQIMGTGPIPASRKALQKAGWKVDDLDLVEANEAFAAQACAVNKDMGWNTDIVNVNGGAIAIGHPIGASGARVFNTLVFEMRRRGAKKGLATLCIGGGMGVAMCVEAL